MISSQTELDKLLEDFFAEEKFHNEDYKSTLDKTLEHNPTLKTYTIAGPLDIHMGELDFIMNITGQKTIREAIDQFAVACSASYKEPQQVIDGVKISAYGVCPWFDFTGELKKL